MNAQSNVSVIQPSEQLPAPMTAVTPMAMLAQAVANGMTPDVIEKLMNLADRSENRNRRDAFDQAVAAAKAEIPVIVRNATGHNSKSYADFSAIAKAVDPVLGKHGLSYRFRTVQTEKAITVTCVLFGHGHSEENTLCGPADTTGNKNAIQAIGSTLTYLQRYSLVQALGLAAANDDDGKAGGNGETITQKQADDLVDLLLANNKDRAKFLKWAKVDRLEDIPAAKYQDSVDAIKFKPVQS